MKVSKILNILIFIENIQKFFDKYQKINVSSKMTTLWLTFAISSLWVIAIIFIAVVSSKISQLHIELKNASTTNLFKQFQVKTALNKLIFYMGILLC